MVCNIYKTSDNISKSRERYWDGYDITNTEHNDSTSTLCTISWKYESDISVLLNAVGVEHIAGTVENIDGKAQSTTIKNSNSENETLNYDRFILATGSSTFTPPIAGIAEFAFSVGDLAEA